MSWFDRSHHTSPPFRAEREGPVAEQREGEVGCAARFGIPHLTPTLSAPGGGEGAVGRSLRRQIFAMLALLPLAACGFHPLYGETSAGAYDPKLAAIKVQPVRDRIGQILVSSLSQQLNPTGQPVPALYVLNVQMSVARSDLGIRRDNTSTRGELSINATVSLHEAQGDKIVYSDAVRTVTSFNLPDNAYAATVAEDTARTEAADELGREIAERLAVFMHRGGS
jgi:LPS-assembly lipoprotein